MSHPPHLHLLRPSPVCPTHPALGPSYTHSPHYFIELRPVTWTRVGRHKDRMIFNIWMWAILVACFVMERASRVPWVPWGAAMPPAGPVLYGTLNGIFVVDRLVLISYGLLSVYPKVMLILFKTWRHQVNPPPPQPDSGQINRTSFMCTSVSSMSCFPYQEV